MPTFKYRRLRGDMIETFKIITGIYDNEVTEGILSNKYLKKIFEVMLI
jgi:hypothetical protein